jgi:hypothetical protein
MMQDRDIPSPALKTIQLYRVDVDRSNLQRPGLIRVPVPSEAPHAKD